MLTGLIWIRPYQLICLFVLIQMVVPLKICQFNFNQVIPSYIPCWLVDLASSIIGTIRNNVPHKPLVIKSILGWYHF